MLLLSYLGTFLSFSSILLSHALYSSKSDVVDLTEKNFHELITKTDDVWIVEFYAPWCGHCQSFASEYSKVADVLKGFVKVGAVNVDNDKTLSSKYSVRGFPTVKIFYSDRNNPETYTGERTAKALATDVLNKIRSKVSDRLGGKIPKEDGSKDVIELTDSNFDQLVLKSDDIWLVEFFAPWCGHCKNLAPHWEKAATELKGKVKLGALDAIVHSVKANEYGVQGYPTIKYFHAGKKDKNSAEDYQGGRTASDIVSFALDKLMESVPSPEIEQVTSDEILKKACDKPLCVIAILPHILDCQADCRSSYIKTLTELGDKFKKKMWGWVWSEAGVQPELESSLEIGGFGYPAMAVLNAKKMKYSILRGAFSNDGINEFLRDLSYGRGTTAPLRGASLPKISLVDKWDGKDGEPPVDDVPDLSDVDLDSPPNDEL